MNRRARETACSVEGIVTRGADVASRGSGGHPTERAIPRSCSSDRMARPLQPGAPMLGEAIGNYRIIGKLGEGGMGVVWLAEHALIGRRAAVKVLLPAYSRDSEMVSRFFNEARAVARIKHTGLVEVFDFGYHADGSAYLVMEYLEGQSLASLLRRGR